MARIISRHVAIMSCFFGMLQVLLAIILIICGFIHMGVYNDVNSVGLWAGFPVLIPGCLSMVVLATRDRRSSIAFVFVCLGALAICIVHGFIVLGDLDLWKKFTDHVDAGSCVEEYGRCKCPTETPNKYEDAVRVCELYKFGYELFFTMIITSFAAAVVSIFALIYGICGVFFHGVKASNYDRPQAQDNGDNRRHYNYYADN